MAKTMRSSSLGRNPDFPLEDVGGGYRIDLDRPAIGAYRDFHQGPEINGPKDVCWLIDFDLKTSALRLQENHRTEALRVCFESRECPDHFNYGHWLAKIIHDVRSTDFTCPRYWLKSNPETHAPDHWRCVVFKHQAFLAYIGELQKLIQRCREAEVNLVGYARDLRDLDIVSANKRLDERGVPKTNYINTYAAYYTPLPISILFLQDFWRVQDDSQINELNEEML